MGWQRAYKARATARSCALRMPSYARTESSETESSEGNPPSTYLTQSLAQLNPFPVLVVLLPFFFHTGWSAIFVSCRLSHRGPYLPAKTNCLKTRREHICGRFQHLYHAEL